MSSSSDGHHFKSLEELEIDLNDLINQQGNPILPFAGKYDNDRFIYWSYAPFENKGIKLRIKNIEHPPPHFHIEGPDFDASFDILNGELLVGEVPNKIKRAVKQWHLENRDMLVYNWNKTRYPGCPVGEIDSNTLPPLN